MLNLYLFNKKFIDGLHFFYETFIQDLHVLNKTFIDRLDRSLLFFVTLVLIFLSIFVIIYLSSQDAKA
jgi:hypothetical protein